MDCVIEACLEQAKKIMSINLSKRISVKGKSGHCDEKRRCCALKTNKSNIVVCC